MTNLKDYLFYQDDWSTIYHADCREILPLLPPVDLVLTDPPYGRNMNFGRRSESIIGDEDVSLRDLVIEMLPNISKFIFGSPLCLRPQDIKAVLIWDKSELTGMGDLSFPWKITHEEIYVMGNGFKIERRDGSVLRFPLRPSWSNHPDSISGLHPAEKPVSLIQYLLTKTNARIILDPFMGSGTTLVAAKNLNRKAIGIEIEEKYCVIAVKRLRQEVFDFGKK